MSINLDLEDVSVVLKQPKMDSKLPRISPNSSTSLACVNFIKSTLTVDSYSDGSQDIDLVSQEILITDTRNCGNVFSNILKPLNVESGGIVQAEVHSRKRQENTKFTILLNNMRMMAILDWLELARDFIMQIEEPPKILTIPATVYSTHNKSPDPVDPGTFELKLNITDSELVFVENTELLDSNAVILKVLLFEQIHLFQY